MTKTVQTAAPTPAETITGSESTILRGSGPIPEGVSAEQYAAMERHREILLDDARARYAASLGAKNSGEYEKEVGEIKSRKLHHLFDSAGNRLDEKGQPIETSAEAVHAHINEIRAEHHVPAKPIPVPPGKRSWAEVFAEKKIGLSKRIHKNFHSDSPGQMMFSSTTTMLGGMFMLEGLMSMIAPKTISVMTEDGTIAEKRAHPLKRDLVTIGVGASAVAAGLLINIEGKGR